MDSRQDSSSRNTLNASPVLKFGQFRQSTSVLPGFESFKVNTSMNSSDVSTYNDLCDKTLHQTMHFSSIPSSQNPQYNSHPQNQFSASSFRNSYVSLQGQSALQPYDHAVVVKPFESLTLNSPRMFNPAKKSYDDLYHKQLLENISEPSIPGSLYHKVDRTTHTRSSFLNSVQHNSSLYSQTPPVLPINNTLTAESNKCRKKKLNRRSGRNTELNFLEESLRNVDVNLGALQSIGIGPLCPLNKNSLFPLVTKIHHLCDYLSMLGDERCQVESKILEQEFNSKNTSYSVPHSKSLSNHILFVQRCLFIEHSMMLSFIKSYSTYLDKEVERNTNILLNELEMNTSKLITFETLRIYQKHGELIQGDRDRIKELELLLSELIADVCHCCMMFFIMRHDSFLKMRMRRSAAVGIRQRKYIG